MGRRRPRRAGFRVLAVLACACVLAAAIALAAPPQGPAAQAEPAEAALAAGAPAAASNQGDVAVPGDDSATPAAPGDDPAAYVPGYALATLADGVTDDQALEALAAEPALAGASIESHVDGSLVKLALPESLPVERAVELIAQTSAFDSAQPDYRYYIQEGAAGVSAAVPGAASADAATAALVRTAENATANLIAGTALGDALSIQAAAPNDPYYGRQWSLPSVNAPEAWSLVAANANAPSAVTVAVIDDGFLVNHEDLAGRVVDAYNAEAGTTAVNIGDSSHGTHVAGIVSAVTNNGKGVASVANNALGLMLIRASDSKGDIDTSSVVKAYDYIVKNASVHNVRVVNMSLGAASRSPVTRSTDSAMYDAIAKARNAGIVTVAASCNAESGYTPPFYAFPSDFDNVVSVMNLAQSGNADGVARDSSSNYNVSRYGVLLQRAKNISAPGTGIYSTYRGNSSYGLESGTSMASPLVAGVFGLMFTVNPGLTPSRAEQLLYSSAKDLAASPASSGWDRYTGYGEVDAAAAVRAAGAAEPSAKTDIATCTVSAPNAVYTGKAVEPEVRVSDGTAILVRGSDYTVEFRDNVNVGTGAYTVRGLGDYDGVCVGTFSIAKAPLRSFSLKAASAKYDGKSHKPAVSSVVASSGASPIVVSSANYAVSYQRNGVKTTDFKSVGVITVKVTGKANCSGTLTKTFKVKPKGTSIAKLKAARKGIGVTWKKRTAQTTGYQIRVATDKAFTKNVKIVRVGKAAVTSKTVKPLKAKKRYYVKVRTYKKADGTKVYSSWSKAKTVKTK